MVLNLRWRSGDTMADLLLGLFQGARLRKKWKLFRRKKQFDPLTFIMDQDLHLVQACGLPGWMAALLLRARRLRGDRARRRRAYRLLHRKLVFHGLGVMATGRQPTFVYPEQVKLLMRLAFPEDVCDYPDPAHQQVVYITMEDLHNIHSS